MLFENCTQYIEKVCKHQTEPNNDTIVMFIKNLVAICVDNNIS